MWEEADLQMTIGNEEGDGILSTCNEYSDWTTGIGQAVFNTICLQGGRSYSFGFIPGSDTAHFEIDSVVILLYHPVGLSTFIDPVIQFQYN